MAAGVWLAMQVSVPFMLSVLSLWVMGCVYNIPPVRSKDLPYRRRAERSGEQPDPHVGRLVHRHGLDHRAIVAASQLLDDRVLFHGAETVRRVPEHRRSGSRGGVSKVVRVFHERSPARRR